MKLEETCHDAVKIVTVREPRIDAAATIRFKEAMREAAGEGPNHLVLDLSHVTFIDSSGLGAIVAAMKQMGAGRRLDLAALTPDVAKVFRLTRLDTVFVIHDDAQALIRRATG